jgi:hypothetical protein
MKLADFMEIMFGAPHDFGAIAHTGGSVRREQRKPNFEDNLSRVNARIQV